MKAKNALMLIQGLISALFLFQAMVEDASAFGILYQGKSVVDIEVGEGGPAKKIELYRDEALIKSWEKTGDGTLYYSDTVISGVHSYTQKTYTWETDKWVFNNSSYESIDTEVVKGVLHNTIEWTNKLDRFSVLWKPSEGIYHVYGVFVPDDLWIVEGTQVVLVEGDIVTGGDAWLFKAENVTFTRAKESSDSYRPRLELIGLQEEPDPDYESGAIVKGCTFGDRIGIRLTGCKGAQIIDNEFLGTEIESLHYYFNAIALTSLSTANAVTGNTVPAIWVDNKSPNNVIKQNNVKQIKTESSSNTIKENEVSDDFIEVSGTLNQIIKNTVRVSGEKEQNAIAVTGDENRIEANQVRYTGDPNGATRNLLVNGNKNTIVDNEFRGRLHLVNGTENHVERNRIKGTGTNKNVIFLDGITIDAGNGNVIKKNDIIGCGYCINVSDSLSNQIENNACNTCRGGISLTYVSNDNVVAFNHLWGGEKGIDIWGGASNNGVHENIIEDFTQYGISISNDSTSNWIYNNLFRRNEKHAEDMTGNNTIWNKEKTAVNQNIVGGPYLGGNYWDDYQGSDGDGDELGDTPYAITDYDGNPLDSDDYPLVPKDHYAEITLTPSSLDFGKTEVKSTSGSKILTLSNTGTALLMPGKLSINGTDADKFTLKNDPCSGATIESSGNCIAEVVFSPDTEGEKSATLRISSNDVKTGTINVALTGNGSVPIPGDLDMNWVVDLKDAILALKVVANMKPPSIYTKTEMSGDQCIGLAEAIHALQHAAELRD